MSKNKVFLYVLIGCAGLLGLAGFSLFVGVYQFEGNLIRQMIAESREIAPNDAYVLFQLRLPRIVMAILIGSALAVSGSCIQGVFKNPLATPSLIGITSGASLFAAVSIVLGHTLKPFLPELVQYSFISMMAFLGAILTMIFVYRVSTTHRKTNVMIMLLAGVAISALAGAITGFLTYLTDEEQLRDLTFWMLGSLGGASWLKNLILLIVILFSFFLLMPKGKALNAMMLGEQDALHIGIPIESTKRQIIILTALMVGTSVSFAGAIGFVGLIVPYILRLLLSSDYRVILPLSAVLGGILLLGADTISRTIVAPSEMPIGVLTAFLGAPVFIAILIRFKTNMR